MASYILATTTKIVGWYVFDTTKEINESCFSIIDKLDLTLVPVAGDKETAKLMTVITGIAFIPTLNKCYEIHFGKLDYKGQVGFVTARIKANGLHSSQWIDLDTAEILDKELQNYVVQGFKEIDCVTVTKLRSE